MAKHHKLKLPESEIQALVELRNKGEPAYLRERATAILKIHEGFSPHEVARRGLLKKRDPDTVYAWLRRYREQGIGGSSNKPGRGRKPAFSPKSPEEAESELLVAIGQDPGCVNKDWAETGTKYPLARQSYLPQETCYGIGALNPHTGDVIYQQVKSCTVVALHAFYTQICQRYPNVERIYLVQDNRAIHFHANLMAALLPQTTAFVKPVPPNWSDKQSKKIGELEKLPIEILQLPTYAPWTNPIEKLWRWARQSVIHLHRLSDDWTALQEKVIDFMEQFKDGSQELLHFCQFRLTPCPSRY